MNCTVCNLPKISPKFAPFGGFICENDHLQCCDCNNLRDGMCTHCNTATSYVSVRFAQPPEDATDAVSLLPVLPALEEENSIFPRTFFDDLEGETTTIIRHRYNIYEAESQKRCIDAPNSYSYLHNKNSSSNVIKTIYFGANISADSSSSYTFEGESAASNVEIREVDSEEFFLHGMSADAFTYLYEENSSCTYDISSDDLFSSEYLCVKKSSESTPTVTTTEQGNMSNSAEPVDQDKNGDSQCPESPNCHGDPHHHHHPQPPHHHGQCSECNINYRRDICEHCEHRRHYEYHRRSHYHEHYHQTERYQYCLCHTCTTYPVSRCCHKEMDRTQDEHKVDTPNHTSKNDKTPVDSVDTEVKVEMKENVADGKTESAAKNINIPEAETNSVVVNEKVEEGDSQTVDDSQTVNDESEEETVQETAQETKQETKKGTKGQTKEETDQNANQSADNGQSNEADGGGDSLEHTVSQSEEEPVASIENFIQIDDCLLHPEELIMHVTGMSEDELRAALDPDKVVRTGIDIRLQRLLETIHGNPLQITLDIQHVIALIKNLPDLPHDLDKLPIEKQKEIHLQREITSEETEAITTEIISMELNNSYRAIYNPPKDPMPFVMSCVQENDYTYEEDSETDDIIEEQRIPYPVPEPPPQFMLLTSKMAYNAKMLSKLHYIRLRAIPSWRVQILRTPIECPESCCKRVVFVSDFVKHLTVDHSKLPLERVSPHQVKNFFIDPRLAHVGVSKCNVLYLLRDVISDLGSSRYRNYLPLMVMSTRMKLTDMCNICSSKYPLAYSDIDFIMIWLTGIKPEELPIATTLTVWSRSGNTPVCHITNAGYMYSIRASQNIEKIWKSGNCLLLSTEQVRLLTKNGKELLELQLIVH